MHNFEHKGKWQVGWLDEALPRDYLALSIQLIVKFPQVSLEWESFLLHMFSIIAELKEIKSFALLSQ